MAASKLVVVVPSALDKRALSVQLTVSEFRRAFDPVLGDARLVLAQAKPYLAYAILGGLICPQGIYRDFRAHPRSRNLPSAADRVTVINLDSGRAIYRVTTKVKFVEELSRVEEDAPSVFDELAQQADVRVWGNLAAVSWPLHWLGVEDVQLVAEALRVNMLGESGRPIHADADEDAVSRGASQDAPEVRARRFTLVDEQGNEAGTWAVEPDGSVAFTMTDADGLARLLMSVQDDGRPLVTLLDEDSSPRVIITAEPVSIRLQSRDGVKVSLDITDAQGASVVVVDRDQQSAQISSRSDGYGPGVALFDQFGQTRFMVALGGPGSTSVGAPMPRRGEPVLGVSDDRGVPRFVVGQTSDGSVEAAFLHSDGRVRKKLPGGFL